MSNLFLLSERLLDNSGEMNSSTILSPSALHPLIFGYGGHIALSSHVTRRGKRPSSSSLDNSMLARGRVQVGQC